MAVTHGSGLGGGSSISGAGVTDRIAIWGSPVSVTSDSGLDRQGTGTSLMLRVGDPYQGIQRESLGILGIRGGNGSYGHGHAGIFTAQGLTAGAAPTLTIHQTASCQIQAVSDAGIVDHDFFTLDGTDVYEFVYTAGTETPGNIPILVDGLHTDIGTANLMVTAINTAALGYTAANGGGLLSLITVTMDTVDVPGGLNSENMTDGAFTVSAFAYRSATSNYSLAVVDFLEDGSSVTSATASVPVNTAPDVLDAHDYIEIVWAHPTGSYYSDLYRTVWTGGDTTTGLILDNSSATTINDTGIVGGGEVLPAPSNTTGRLRTIGPDATHQQFAPIQAALSTAGATLDLFSFNLPADQDLASFEIEYTITYEDAANNYSVANGVERLTYWNSTLAGGIVGGGSGAFTNVASAVVTIGAVTWSVATVGTVTTVRVADTLVGVLGGAPAQTITASIRSLSSGTAEV